MCKYFIQAPHVGFQILLSTLLLSVQVTNIFWQYFMLDLDTNTVKENEI